jgi:lycopene cyclase domain-containing protein
MPIEKFTYLIVDVSCLIFPLLFSFHPKFKFYPQWRYFIFPCVLTAIFFIAWDILFTAKGIWSFNPNYVVGIYCGGLPLEEYLFFIFIPYACLFTYYCIDKFLDHEMLQHFSIFFKIWLWVMCIGLFLLAMLQLHQFYTSVTFIILSVTLIILLLKNASYIPVFCIAYTFILIPFLLSNGILTGSFIKEPVVLYNNAYNLGKRILTIPMEDIFYGMLLMLFNVIGFEYARKHVTPNHV